MAAMQLIYSFTFMLISLTSLVNIRKIQKKFHTKLCNYVNNMLQKK